MPSTEVTGFASPFDVPTPEGAEGWQGMYPYYLQFSEDRRKFEDGKFWFHDSMHYPNPMYPFDLVLPENTWVCLNQNTTRVFRIPTAKGLDHRIVNGYVYVSPNTVSDPDEIAERAQYFTQRATYYFEHWNEIYDKWVEKADTCRANLQAIRFEPLPEVEPQEVITESRTFTSGHALMQAYNRLLENIHEIGYLHFEMLGLGYGAYMTFREFCHNAFPGISDQAIAKMVAGIDILMFRPDEELKKLATLAIELGVGEHFKNGAAPHDVIEAVRSAPGGQEWVSALEVARDPWFWFCTGAGMTHEDPAWNDDFTVPFSVIKSYIEKLERGESLDRPVEEVLAERERITAEYRDLLPTDEDRAPFDELVQLARTVYPFVENHNFYCEHQHHTRLWHKVRELGDVFVHHGFLEDREDVFYLHRYEVYQAIWDLQSGWAAETADRRAYWQRMVEERKRIMDALRAWSPPPALGKAPERIDDAFTVMLWGINMETVERWQRAGGDGGGTELSGVAASPGVVEGTARVIISPSELDQVQDGEILVCQITAPSWAPVFTRIAGAVSDIGGIMAHAAIVSREYGLPAVVGTGFGTKTIKTGQRVRVDGDKGLVEILD